MRVGLALVFAAGLLAQGAQADCNLAAVAVLPMDDAGAPFVVPAQVNGQAASLRLDTGSGRTTLNLPSADRLGVAFHMADRPTYGLGGVAVRYYGYAGHVRIGGIAADHWGLDGRAMWPAGAAHGLDGYLAMDMLSTYDLDIDPVGKHLIVFKATGLCLKPTVTLSPPLYATPLVLIDGDQEADVDVVVEGQRFRAMLDSGDAHSTMFRKAAERLGLDLAPLSAPGHATRPGIGAHEVAYMPHVFASVSVGDITFRNMKIEVLEQLDRGVDRQRTGSRLAASTLSSGYDMTLGADFMRKVHIWISHSSHQLIMQYPPLASALPQ